jgi:hypothetical protein
MEASSINQPHENEAVEDFFGDGDTPVEEPTPEPTEPEPVVTEPEPAATEPEAPATEPEPEPTEPEPVVTEDVPQAEAQAPQAPAAPLDPAVEPPEPEAESKAEPRDYVVFQEMALTERMLKSLLEEFRTSSDPEPRKVYYVISTETKHTAIAALEAAYTTHKDALGEEATLVALTAKKWQPKRIKPKVRTRVSLDIS